MNFFYNLIVAFCWFSRMPSKPGIAMIRARAQIASWPILALALAFSPGCDKGINLSEPHSRSFSSMGTFAFVTLAQTDAARLAEAQAIADEALKRVEEACSMFRPESDIARLNNTAGAEAITISPLTEKILRIARHHGELSSGAFDVTVGPLMRLWGFRGGQPTFEPDPALIRETLKNVGWQNVAFSNGTARLLRPGACVDLGGVAKGFGVDLACEELFAAGITNALVNLGGNIRVFGAPDSTRQWRAAVRHPFIADQTLGTIKLESGMAVATSGHYEQFIIIQGRRATHIMDPRTGCPVENMASVTVLAKTAADADALSTAAFVLGLDAIPNLAEQAGAIGAIAVPDRQPLEIWVTSGIAERFQPRPDLRTNIRQFAP